MGENPVARAKKGAQRDRRWIVFEDESGFSLTPPLRQTWAPRGRTPVVRHRFNWKRVSAASALCYRWDGRRARLYFQTRPGAYNDVGLIGFLEELRQHFRGERVLLLWDGLSSHRSRRMTSHLETQRSWLQVERMPAYAPELNPAEGVWGYLKGGVLANRGDDTVEELIELTTNGVRKARSQQRLLFGFLGQTGLTV
jgi:transposase